LYSGVWTLRFFVSLMILGFPGCQTILNFCLKSGVHFSRVVANPAGYVTNLSLARSPSEFEFENLAFNLIKINLHDGVIHGL